MTRFVFLLLLTLSLSIIAEKTIAQQKKTTSGTVEVDFQAALNTCKLNGSITIYDYQRKAWLLSDSIDASVATQPASTFKVINLLIALETGVIHNENDIIKWPGSTDTVLYGYRPEIYKDMSVKEAFEVSAGWVFIELAKKIGRQRYARYLKQCEYGNLDLSYTADDFWNFGPMKISPMNQVNFLIRVYEGRLPFSKRNLAILKNVMITETTRDYILRSKTGWTRIEGNDIGWWVGYVERKKHVYFFATRLIKERATINPNFSNCRKEVTRNVLKQLKAIE